MDMFAQQHVSCAKWWSGRAQEIRIARTGSTVWLASVVGLEFRVRLPRPGAEALPVIRMLTVRRDTFVRGVEI